MLISQLFNRFILFSFLGWIYECIYCAVRTGHWDNRGFLYGPVCPIYGCGVTALLLLRAFTAPDSGFALLPLWGVFLISMLGSAVLEYLTSFVLERHFHARWWDYSNVPLNIHGRICLPASVGFGAAGVVLMRWVLPFFERTADAFSLPIPAEEAASIFLAALFAADFALTVDTLLSLTARLDQISAEFDTRMELAVQKASIPKQAISAYAREAKESSAALLGRAEELPQAIRSAAEESATLLRGKLEESGQALEDMTDRFRKYASTLSQRQQYSLRSIPFYSTERLSRTAERMKEAISALPSSRSRKEKDAGAGSQSVQQPEAPDGIRREAPERSGNEASGESCNAAPDEVRHETSGEGRKETPDEAHRREDSFL
ncbi:putative ABC transporter permease [Lachnoclostridium sp. Marseille-P6806]|uniref:putative ABC transporter permease n=1 Tax=Lachnoclostridium sp. Marseille-P6806 TaxID=2364793 RepID=UPI00102F981C|nr:hypothetical protein [Lachnoclostridium sp. Marseille-P6806]